MEVFFDRWSAIKTSFFQAQVEENQGDLDSLIFPRAIYGCSLISERRNVPLIFKLAGGNSSTPQPAMLWNIAAAAGESVMYLMNVYLKNHKEYKNFKNTILFVFLSPFKWGVLEFPPANLNISGTLLDSEIREQP